jgi:hypothetical protein
MIDVQMPLRQYFLIVGSALLVIFFATDWCMPHPKIDRDKSGVRFPVIRIHSELKGPVPVIFDTAQYGLRQRSAVQVTAAAPPPVAASEASADPPPFGPRSAEADSAAPDKAETEQRIDQIRTRHDLTSQPGLVIHRRQRIESEAIAARRTRIREAFAQAIPQPAALNKNKTHLYRE